MADNDFPTRTQLWQGSILHSIVHAIWTVSSPLLAYEVYWDGLNYNLNNSMGARGKVTFGKDVMVGVFFSENSPRNPYRTKMLLKWESFFHNAPDEAKLLAETTTTQYFLDNYKGEVIPVITAAFWSEGETLKSHYTWHDFLLHSDDLLYAESLSISEAMDHYRDNYELSERQLHLIKPLFAQRLTTPENVIMSQDEYAILIEDGTEGLVEARELLASINIHLPIGV